MRVNLGCGDRYAPGWHNVDRADCPHRKDAAVDLRDLLPRSWTNLEYVYAGHVLEHMRVGDVLVLLERLLACMAPDGELMVVGPDVVVAQAMLDGGQDIGVTLDSLKYGASRWPGDEHRWECSERDIQVMLRATGWTLGDRLVINQVPEMWPVADRRPQWQCAVSARRA